MLLRRCYGMSSTALARAATGSAAELGGGATVWPPPRVPARYCPSPSIACYGPATPCPVLA
eukprot:3511391-Rhodomonas_salina.2